MPAMTTSMASASTWPVVPVMTSLPKTSENWVAPRPRKKAQLLPARKSTELTNDAPAIQMSQLAPERTACACRAISVTTDGGPVGLGGVVLGGPVVLMKTPRGKSLGGETLAQNQANFDCDSDGFEPLGPLVELALPAHDRHLRPVLIVHRIEGKDLLHALWVRRKLDRRRHLVGFDVRNEIGHLGEGDSLQRNHLGVSDQRLGRQPHPRLLEKLVLIGTYRGERVQEPAAAAKVEPAHFHLESWWAPPGFDSVLRCPEIPNVLGGGVEGALDTDLPAGRLCLRRQAMSRSGRPA